MISPRPKLRLDREVPVLFSLPNLRARGSHPSASPSPETAAPAPHHTLRVDPPAPKAMPEIEPEVSPIETHTATAFTAPQVPHAASQSRSWMERVGSRLILVVTLMVIVTAAWITGRRMPASKPDPWSDSPLIENEVAVTDQTQAAEAAATGSAARQSPQVRSESAVAASASTTGETSADVDQSSGGNRSAAVNPPSTQSSAWTLGVARSHLPTAPMDTPAGKPQGTPTNDSPQIASASQGPSPSFTPETPAESLPVFNTVSMQSPASTAESTAASSSSETLSLDPPLPASPSVDSSSSKGPTGKTTSGMQTSTPHAPVVDPEVLLPWFNEQVAARNYRKSPTPNAIGDWARYLPNATSGDAQVRAASSNEPTGAPFRAQQAAVPHGIITNPYSQ